MASDRFTKALTGISKLLTGTLICVFALPFFGTWRLILLLVFCLEKLLQNTPIPILTIAVYTPAHSHFLQHWHRFLKTPVIAPLIKHRTRIVCTSLLLIETSLTLAILYKSCSMFIPWLLNHKNEKRTRNDKLFYTALFIASCAPFACILGIGVATPYYARKYWKYGKFEKKMRRKPGGRGYWKDLSDAEEKVKERRIREEKAIPATRYARQDVTRIAVPRTPETVRSLDLGYEERVGFNGEEKPRSGVVQRPEPVAAWEKNAFTKNGLTSIWGVKEKFKGGYDGRETRRKAWEEDLEMVEREGRKESRYCAGAGSL